MDLEQEKGFESRVVLDGSQTARHTALVRAAFESRAVLDGKLYLTDNIY